MVSRSPDQSAAVQPQLREGAVVLGIETSCDETAASVVAVECGALRVRSTVVASQHAVHEQFAGVVPELASRAHLERLVPVVQRALVEATCELRDVHAIAVGHRPGLIGSLLVGTAAAKALAWSLGVPLLGVDHVAAHLVAGFLDRAPPAWPALGLVVSGGHTHLARVAHPCDAHIIGQTIDDAIGEAFDKAAVVLGLGYPGGPRLDAASEGGNEVAVDFPIPQLTNKSRRGDRGDGSARGDESAGGARTARGDGAALSPPTSFDFSFSGLKTALLYEVRGVPLAPARRGTGRSTGSSLSHSRSPAPSPLRSPPHETASVASTEPTPPPLTPERVRDLAASFQRAAVRQVIERTERALAAHPVPTLLVGGGVVANRRLRAELLALAARSNVDLLLPRPEYCVDNAAMIAALAHFRLARGEHDPLSLAPSPRSALSAR